MKQRVLIRVYGDVQGVFFRYSAKQKADALRIQGIARNEDDGSVYLEAEGERDNLQAFIAWCREGSPPAQVRKVHAEFVNHRKNFQDFVIE